MKNSLMKNFLLKASLVTGLVLIVNAVLKAQGSADAPKTVASVDLKKYVGLWYEIAKIPNRFQSDCAGETTAWYEILDDGKIKVVNSCSEKDGSKNVADGIAKVVDTKTNAKLEVSFFSILGIRPFWGDYWILGLGNNYDYAVVGTPDRKYGWILSRTPEMTEDQLQQAFQTLKDNGYNPAKFVPTPQKAAKEKVKM